MKEWTMMWQDLVFSNLPGRTRLVIRGTSMLPAAQPGDEVIIEPVRLEDLELGDWVVVRAGGDALMHRYVGCRKGRLLTKGDHHLVLDPAWPTSALIGRVEEAWRQDVCVYQRRQGRGFRQRLLARGHLWAAMMWRVVSRMKHWLTALLMLSLTATGVWASVTFTDFEVDAGEDDVLVYWETVDEVGNLGFYVWRAVTEDAGYEKLPIDSPEEQFIPANVFGIGVYDYVDSQVTPGVIYWYKVQDVPEDGSNGEYTEPLSVTLSTAAPTPTATRRAPTSTPTPTPPGEDATSTPTATPTATPTSSPSATATPASNVRFWADEAELTAGDCTTVQWQADDVQAVYFDGIGVTGVGARTLCPCETQTHTLTVVYPDGRREDLTVELEVSGTCEEPVATPTQRPTLTSTPVSQGDDGATPESGSSAQVTASPTATPRVTPTPSTAPTDAAEAAKGAATVTATPTRPTATPTVTPTPVEPGSSEVDLPDPESGSGDVIVEGYAPRGSSRPTMVRWLVLVAFIGMGLVAGGAWFYWSRR
jgi:hypothetical protein